MDATTPERLLEQLNGDQIAARLRDLEARRRALLVLLRAARALERGREPGQPQPEGRRDE
jgi:hypothetical protein